MSRFLAGIFSVLLLAAAGIFWWQGKAGVTSVVPDAPMAHAAVLPAAPMAEPPQATAKTREEKRFGRYDKDKSGEINAGEYFASRKKAFAKLDANGDGRLSFDEWSVKTREKFAKADANRSRTLTAAEFATTATVRKTKPNAPCPPPQQRGEEEEG